MILLDYFQGSSLESWKLGSKFIYRFDFFNIFGFSSNIVDKIVNKTQGIVLRQIIYLEDNNLRIIDGCNLFFDALNILLNFLLTLLQILLGFKSIESLYFKKVELFAIFDLVDQAQILIRSCFYMTVPVTIISVLNLWVPREIKKYSRWCKPGVSLLYLLPPFFNSSLNRLNNLVLFLNALLILYFRLYLFVFFGFLLEVDKEMFW